jgi:putative cardiolipin synthase
MSSTAESTARKTATRTRTPVSPFLCLVLTLSFAPAIPAADSLHNWIDASCEECLQRMEQKTGAYILERGEDALVARAWLAGHAERSIDVQYFIWSALRP